MYSLKKGLEQSLFELGFDRDNRPFSPHITMGRVRRDTKQKENEYITQALSNFQKFDGGMFHVGSVHIFQSQLKPTGAVHTIYKTATLTKVKI